MGDTTKGYIECPYCHKPIKLTGSIPPATGCALVPILFVLVFVLAILFLVMWTYPNLFV